jgi:hypothetical protein
VVRFPERARNYSLLHNVQIESGARPASYLMGSRGIYSRIKLWGSEADRAPQFSAVDNNGGVIPPLPNMPTWNSV